MLLQSMILKRAAVFLSSQVCLLLFVNHIQNSKYMDSKHILNPTFYGVRYIVEDIDDAVSFYKDLLGFTVEMLVATGFAKLTKGDLNLYLNKPGAGGAGKSMPDGTVPAPGGWNRIQMEVDNLEEFIATLKKRKAHFRNELVIGVGGKQILLQDPSGNLVELFEPNEETRNASKRLSFFEK
jgi:catechol 2,3-dioxygenase-like lactoylglutathione lyase family enzyme